MQTLFITGGTGYIGSRLLNLLDKTRYRIIALVRQGSEHKLPNGIEMIIGDVFKPEEWISKVPAQSIFIHMLGVSHPSPSKKKLFEIIDLRALKIVADIAKSTQAKKFIYMSVAMHPSSIMKDFQNAKASAEEYIKSLNLSYVFIRPWYVLGPGHWWPYLLFPVFKLLEILPVTSKNAKAFGFVTINQMVHSLNYIVNHSESIPKLIEIDDIKKMSL